MPELTLHFSLFVMTFSILTILVYKKSNIYIYIYIKYAYGGILEKILIFVITLLHFLSYIVCLSIFDLYLIVIIKKTLSLTRIVWVGWSLWYIATNLIFNISKCICFLVLIIKLDYFFFIIYVQYSKKPSYIKHHNIICVSHG